MKLRICCITNWVPIVSDMEGILQHCCNMHVNCTNKLAILKLGHNLVFPKVATFLMARNINCDQFGKFLNTLSFGSCPLDQVKIKKRILRFSRIFEMLSNFSTVCVSA